MLWKGWQSELIYWNKVLALLSRFTASGAGRFFSYIAIGASGTLVNLAFFWIGQKMLYLPEITTGIFWLDPLYLAVPFGYQIAIIWNYLWNNLITFSDRAHQGLDMLQGFLSFEVFALVGLAIFWLLFQLQQAVHYLDTWLGLDSALLAYNAIAILLSFAGKFVLNIKYTWKKAA